MNIFIVHALISILLICMPCRAMEMEPLLAKTKTERIARDVETLENVNDHVYVCIQNLVTKRPFYIPKFFALEEEKGFPRYVCLHSEAELVLLEVLVGLKTCPERKVKLLEYFQGAVKKICNKASLFDKIYFLEAIRDLHFPKEFQEIVVIFINESEKINSKDIPQEDTVSHCLEIFKKVANARDEDKVSKRAAGVKLGLKITAGSYVIAESDPLMGSLADLPDTLLMLLCWQDRENDLGASKPVVFPMYKQLLPKAFLKGKKHACDVPIRAAKKRGYLMVTTPRYNPMLFDLFIPILYQYAFSTRHESIALSTPVRCYPALLDALQYMLFCSEGEDGSVDIVNFCDLSYHFAELLGEFHMHDLAEVLNSAAADVRDMYSVAPECLESLKACLKFHAAHVGDIISDNTDVRHECAGSIADLLVSYRTLRNKHPLLSYKLMRVSTSLGKLFGLGKLQDFITLLADDTRLPLFDQHAALEHEGCMNSCELLSMKKPDSFPYEAFLQICRHLGKKYKRTLLETLNKNLARQNYRSVADIDSEFSQKIAPPGSIKVVVPAESVIQQFAGYLEKQLKPDDEFRRRTALAFLQVNKPFLFQEEVLDERSWMDLELVCGQKMHANEYVMTSIPTFTQIGHVVMMQRAVNVTSHIAKLRKNQSRITVLRGHAKFEDLCKALIQLKEAETGVFSFWDNGDWIERQFDDLMLKFGGLDRKFTCVKKFCDWWNSHTAMLELADRWKQVATIVGTPVGVAGALVATIFAPGTGAVATKAVTGAMNGTSLAKTVPELIAHFGDSISFLACFRICLHLKLLQLANYFKALDEVKEILKAINTDGLFDEFLMSLGYEEFSEIKRLHDLLVTETFKDKHCFPNTFVDALGIFEYCTGRILNAFNIVRHHKNELLPAISALAEIDILASAGKLLNASDRERAKFEAIQLIAERKALRKTLAVMQQYGRDTAAVLLQLQDHDARIAREGIKEPNLYCLPDFIDNAPEPFIGIEGSWNPLLRVPSIVTNDLIVGDSSHPRNVVINGPNAGGKSSIMKGIIIAIVMSQSIGIAPASALTFTPFEKIRAYLNITDDQAGGSSLFMSAVTRAFEVYQDVKHLRERDGQAFSLTVFDELFNGTSSLEGEAAARKLVEDIGREPHNLNLITTHFKSLMTLADQFPELFVNYKVTADASGQKLKYPFKLEKGVSDQCIAFQVLAEKGFDQEFISGCSQNVDMLRNRTY